MNSQSAGRNSETIQEDSLLPELYSYYLIRGDDIFFRLAGLDGDLVSVDNFISLLFSVQAKFGSQLTSNPYVMDPTLTAVMIVQLPIRWISQMIGCRRLDVNL
jgi:hypothetical protein